MAYWACVVARNAEGTISQTLNSILGQKAKPKLTVVVDDGSSDKTRSILSEFERQHSASLRILRLPEKGYDIRRVPANINLAREAALEFVPGLEFCLISGDDCVYPGEYCEVGLDEFERDPDLAIASGVTDGIRPVAGERMPSGSGRLVMEGFWRKIGGRYPTGYGWEAWLPFKALQLGYKVKVIPSLRFEHLRRGGSTHGFRHWGLAMKALGYYPPYAIGRCVKNALFSDSLNEFRNHLSTLRAYLSEPDPSDAFFQEYDLELRKFVASSQKARLMRFVGFR